MAFLPGPWSAAVPSPLPLAFAEAADVLAPAHLTLITAMTAEGGPNAEWAPISGGPITLPDPAARLSALDHLEEFSPRGARLYPSARLPVRIVETGEVEVGWGLVSGS